MEPGGAVHVEDLGVGDTVARQGDRLLGDRDVPGAGEGGVGGGLRRELAGEVDVRRGGVGDAGIDLATVAVHVGAVGSAADHGVAPQPLADVDVGAGSGREVAADDQHVAAGEGRDLGSLSLIHI